MSTGSKFTKIGSAIALSIALLCFGWIPASAAAAPQHTHKKAKKPATPPPPLPSGPTGAVPQVPLDKIAAVPPQVTYENNQLTIDAPNSTLGDILKAVRKQTGAEIDVPNAPERVVTHLGPGSARDIIADLLNGSRFNYVLLGAPDNDSMLTRVVLVPKGPETNTQTPANQVAQQPVLGAPNGVIQQPVAQPEAVTEPEANADDNNNNAGDDNNTVETPAAEADQQPNSQDQQQGVKTPQQMLQEMQQRQMQLQQQQQQQGQQPPQGSGMPPHPPQEQ